MEVFAILHVIKVITEMDLYAGRIAQLTNLTVVGSVLAHKLSVHRTVKEILMNSFEIAAAIAAASVTGDLEMAVIIAKMGQLATDLANGIC